MADRSREELRVFLASKGIDVDQGISLYNVARRGWRMESDKDDIGANRGIKTLRLEHERTQNDRCGTLRAASPSARRHPHRGTAFKWQWSGGTRLRAQVLSNECVLKS